MFLSVIVPAYNEEKRIGRTLSLISDYLKDKDFGYEVIVVDDGSGDMTVNEVETSKLFRGNNLKLIKNGVNRGKGFSVKRGILESVGEYVLICDADMSTPIPEVEKLLVYMPQGNDIVLGSRSIKGADIRVAQPFQRRIMGKTFNLLVKMFLFRGINDTQCGFKLCRGDLARRLAEKMRIDGFSFDVEILYLALRSGYTIKEVGVVWINSADSRVHPVFSSLQMMRDILRIKFIHKKIAL
ncbi:MAG: dolichyl-phosphate beta-glucosyltransferase [Candidatus Omnitrophota bacterium]